MKKAIDYFVDNSVLVNLITLLIVVIGTVSVVTINKDVFPSVDFDIITVRVNFPGSAAEDVEKLITQKLEKEVKVVDGVEELNAMSGEGFSLLNVQVDPDFDVDDVLVEVRNAVDQVSDLPADADTPKIKKLSNTNRSVMKLVLMGDSESRLRDIAKKLQRMIERNKSVSRVTFSGYRDEVVDVLVDQEKMNEQELTLKDIEGTIKNRDFNLSAGNLTTKDGDVLVRTSIELDALKDTKQQIESLVLRSNSSGQSVKIKDVANVRKDYNSDQRPGRANGKKSILLRINAKNSADVITVVNQVKSKVEKFLNQPQYKDLSFSYMEDLSFYVKRRLKVLTGNGIQGLVLVLICLFLFMNLRASLVTTLGAPLAFLVAFTFMEPMGVTLNLISMFGLILVLGMLVDDSIIVAEQFYQRLEEGMDPKEAAKKSAYETLAPVTVTVITTMVAFGSLLFMGGIMGKFLWPVPMVVMICLAASWFECFFILPGHLADFVRLSKNGIHKEKKWFSWLQNQYTSLLEKTLRFSKTTIFIFFGTFLFSLFVLVGMRKELFPSDDATYLFLNIKGPVGTSIVKTEQKVIELEKVVQDTMKKEELVSFRSIAGWQRQKGQQGRSGSHYGSIIIEIVLPDLRLRSNSELISAIEKAAKVSAEGFEIAVLTEGGGPPKGKPLNIELSNDSLTKLTEVANLVNKEISTWDGVLSSEVDFETGKKQILIEIDDAESKRLGVVNIDVAMEIRRAIQGVEATTLRKGDEDIEVRVKFQDKYKKDLEGIRNIKVNNMMGQKVPLRSFAKFVEVPGAFLIRRYEGRRTISVSADIDKRKTASNLLNIKAEKFLDKFLIDHPDTSYILSGENKDTAKSMDSFKKAGIISMFIIFIILVVLLSSILQTLIIMTAIPMGLIGVVAAFWFFDMPIGFMALMGMLGLIGVVINDSIVLVTFINRTVEEKKDTVFNAISMACGKRFRPVLLTTFTTVAGLLPVAHATGGDPFLKPMALSFAYGLMFSTFLTLIFVPCCYYIYARLVLKAE